MTLIVVALLVEILKLINLILEGTPVEQRRAASLAWYYATWPILKGILALAKVPADAIAQIEALMKDVQA